MNDSGYYAYTILESISVKGDFPKNIFGEDALEQIRNLYTEYLSQQEKLAEFKKDPITSIEDEMKKEISENKD